MGKLGLVKVFILTAREDLNVDALVCTVLGVVQIAIGLALVYWSCGFLTTLGLNLINEGIGDCIAGARGMLSGQFSWNEWAKGKAISVNARKSQTHNAKQL